MQLAEETYDGQRDDGDRDAEPLTATNRHVMKANRWQRSYQTHAIDETITLLSALEKVVFDSVVALLVKRV